MFSCHHFRSFHKRQQMNPGEQFNGFYSYSMHAFPIWYELLKQFVVLITLSLSKISKISDPNEWFVIDELLLVQHEKNQ